MSRTAIVVEKVLPYPAEKIWRMLTASELIAKWLMPNDFAPVVGHRFNFRTRPIGNFNGIVHCEVLACEPPHLLRYSWRGGSDADPAQDSAIKGSRLDTEVTWTLTPVEGGTHVRMAHDGFMLPKDGFAYEAMRPGWNRVLDRIGSLIAEFQAS
jgi:uncharacterized protein YndB with AHSA1/START domain